MATGIRATGGAVSIHFEGLDQLIAKTSGKPIYYAPAKRALERAGQAGVRAARAAAPRGPTGQTRAKLAYRVNSVPAPRWVVVKTDATATPRRPHSRKGKTRYPFAYAKRVMYDPKSKHPRWLPRAIERIRGQIDGYFRQAGREIEQLWSKR